MQNRSHFRLTLRSLVLIAVAAFAVTAPAQVTLDALRRDGYGVAPIHQPRPNMLVSPAKVNGANVDLVLDTGFGGDGIALDAVYAHKVGIGPASDKSVGTSAGGKKVTFEHRGSGTVMLGNAQIQGVPLIFANLQGLRNGEEFSTGTHIDRSTFMQANGFLSAGFLRTCSAVIDLHNRLLYLRPPGTGKRVALGPALTQLGLASVPFTQSGNNCIVDVEINGTPTKLVMDTGASLSEVDFSFLPQMKSSSFISGLEFRDVTGSTHGTSHQAVVKSFKIAGESVRAPNLQVTNCAVYSETHGQVVGFLGMDILGQNWSIIDFGEHKLYIARAH